MTQVEEVHNVPTEVVVELRQKKKIQSSIPELSVGDERKCFNQIRRASAYIKPESLLCNGMAAGSFALAYVIGHHTKRKRKAEEKLENLPDGQKVKKKRNRRRGFDDVDETFQDFNIDTNTDVPPSKKQKISSEEPATKEEKKTIKRKKTDTVENIPTEEVSTLDTKKVKRKVKKSDTDTIKTTKDDSKEIGKTTLKKAVKDVVNDVSDGLTTQVTKLVETESVDKKVQRKKRQ
jgi:hypothetical protein